MVRTYLVLAAGGPLLLWLAWTWLGLADSSVWHLAGSAALAVVVVAAAGALLALAFGRVRDWPRFAVFVLLALVLAGVVEWLRGYAPQVGDWAAVRLSRLRGAAVNPRTADTVYVWKLWSAWVLLLALALPVVLRCPGLLRRWRYWAALAGLVVVLAVARALAGWVPAASSLRMEFVSMGLRFGLAWLLSVGALLAFAVSTTRAAAPSVPPPSVRPEAG